MKISNIINVKAKYKQFFIRIMISFIILTLFIRVQLWAQKGNWNITKGMISQKETAVRDTTAFFGDQAWADYEYTLEARREDGREGFLILFRASDAKNYYFWNIGGWGNKEHGLQMKIDDRKKMSGKRIPMIPVKNSQWYKIKIRVYKNKIEGWLDGKKLLDIKDEVHSSGKVGVGTWNTSVLFRNIQVSSLDGRVLFNGNSKLERIKDIDIRTDILSSTPPARKPKKRGVETSPIKRGSGIRKGGTILIQADMVTHRLSPYMIGVNLEDLNNQGYGGLYSQLLYGENFEENIDLSFLPIDKVLLRMIRLEIDEKGNIDFKKGLKRSARLSSQHLAMIKEKIKTADPISRHWRKVQNKTAKGKFKLVRNGTFNGRFSQQVTFLSGKGEIGIDNAGWNRWGINLVKNKPYEGLLRIKSEKSCRIYLSFFDRDGKNKLAEKEIQLKANQEEYQRIKFTLTPGNSDEKGRFAVTLKEPGSIVVGYAFLQPGEWGRYKGLPLRKDLVEAVINQGVKIVRYDGSMVNKCTDGHRYRWKEMIGPRDERKPYTGWFNPFATHGFAIIDVINMCEAAGFLPVPGIRIDETPEDMKDFVEYVNGSADSKWGKKRSEDGHPKPYNLKHIQIGNEERFNEEYVERFKILGKAVWSKDQDITLVISINIRNMINNLKIGPNGELTPQLELAMEMIKFGKENNGKIWWDTHYTGNLLRGAENGKGGVFNLSILNDSVQKFFPGYDFKIAPLEENGNTHDMMRALAHAHNHNTFSRMGDYIVATAVANTLQPGGGVPFWSQGKTFFNASKVWFQPPYYIDWMISQNPQPDVLKIDFQSSENAIDALAKKSEDGKSLVLQVVNVEPFGVETEISLENFKPDNIPARVVRIEGDLDDVNSIEEPKKIKPVHSEWNYNKQGSGMKYTFPAYSFTVITFIR